MAVPQNKSELLAAIDQTYTVLAKDLVAIPPQRTSAKTLEGHAKGTVMSVHDLVAYLLGDASKDVTAQIFAVRMNEIFLMSQPRPIRGVHRAEGWTPQTIAEHAMPALRPSFIKSEVSADVFGWDPI